MKDIRTLLRLMQEGQSIREISDRLGLSKTTVATYQLRAREAGVELAADSGAGQERGSEGGRVWQGWSTITRPGRAGLVPYCRVAHNR